MADTPRGVADLRRIFRGFRVGSRDGFRRFGNTVPGPLYAWYGRAFKFNVANACTLVLNAGMSGGLRF